MASIPEAFGFRAERGGKTAGDEFAAGPGPEHGSVVAAKVFPRGGLCTIALWIVLRKGLQLSMLQHK
jgi:hypothetical protein